MHDLRFSDAAVFEAIEAKEWYRLGSAEKSRLFEKKVDDAVLLLRQFPKIGSLGACRFNREWGSTIR